MTLAATIASVVAADAQAEMQSRIYPGLSVGFGGDDNVLFDGSGGDVMGRGAFHLQGVAWDRDYRAVLDARLSLVGFWERESTVLVGESIGNFRSRLGRHTGLRFRGRARGGDDPLALAQIGVFAAPGQSVVWKTGADVEHHLDARTSIGAGVVYDGVSFLDANAPGDGSAPGIAFFGRYQATPRLTLNVGVESRAYFSDGYLASSVTPMPTVEFRLTRRTKLEAGAGPIVYGDDLGWTVLPAARIGVVQEWRHLGLTTQLSQGLTVPTGRGGVLDALGAEAVVHYGTNWTELRGRGGVYRSHPSPRVEESVVGWAAEVAAFRHLKGPVWLGASAQHVMRLATDVEPSMARNVGWVRIELTRGRP